MRSLIVGMSAVVAAMPFVVRAEQKSVPAGTTVTVAAADLASWASADIDIGAGATLWFDEPNANAEFTGKITGSGNFVANTASATAAPKLFSMKGDASGFTGGFFFTNVSPRIYSPIAVGDAATITIYVLYENSSNSKSIFYGDFSGATDYVYKNRIDLRTNNNQGLQVGAHAVLAGDIAYRAGVIRGSGTTTGKITSYVVSLPFTEGIHVEGPCSTEVASAKITNSGQPLYFGGVTEGFSIFNAFNCYETVFLEGDNLFGDNVALQMGENYTSAGRKSGLIEMNGHSQVFKRIFFKAIPDEADKYVGGIVNTGAPATIRFANHDTAAWLYGKFNGHLSLCVSGSAMFGFTESITNTMDGIVTSKGGNIVVQGYWPNLKGIASCDSGFVDIRLGVSLNQKLRSIDIDSTSKIKVATGLTVKVRQLRIDGVDVPPGRYNKATPGPTSGRFDSYGNGVVEVTGLPGTIVSVW